MVQPIGLERGKERKMLSDEQKSAVAEWFAAGAGVAEIQKRISSEFGIDLTYLDVRLLVADLPQPAEPEYTQDEEPDTSVVSYTNGTYAEGTYSDSAYSDSNYGDSGYTAPSAAESVDESVSVQESPEVHFGASSFAGELDDDIDLSGSVTEKTTGSVTEDSVAKFKKISLKRKKRTDE